MNKRNKIFKILIIVLVVFIMTGCRGTEIETSCVLCGKDTYFPLGLVKFCSGAINFIKIIVPTIIAIVGMIDLVRAVIASDDKKMDEAKQGLIRKFIAGIMIFLVIAIVQFAFKAIPNFEDDETDTFECISYFISGPDDSNTTRCPDRTTGNRKGIYDEEHGYMPEGGKLPDEVFASFSCYGLSEEECKDHGECHWNGTECSPEKDGTIYYCYKKTTGEVVWTKSNASANYRDSSDWRLLFQTDDPSQKTKCENENTNGHCYEKKETHERQWFESLDAIDYRDRGNWRLLEYIEKAGQCQTGKKLSSEKLCWDCRNSGAGASLKFRWASSPPYPTCVANDYSESDCAKQCFKCTIRENGTTIKYRWLKTNPIPTRDSTGSICETTNLDKDQCDS